MNAPVERDDVQGIALSDRAVEQVADHKSALASVEPVMRETAPAADEKICWIEVRQSAYPPDQQVELLNLQAEAEALLLQLQTIHQRRQGQPNAPVEVPQV